MQPVGVLRVYHAVEAALLTSCHLRIGSKRRKRLTGGFAAASSAISATIR
jgi:hypothetical protein